MFNFWSRDLPGKFQTCGLLLFFLSITDLPEELLCITCARIVSVGHCAADV